MQEILNHVVTGTDRKLALLLIHPLGADLGFWNDFIDALGGGLTAIACDLRSSGKSPRASSPPTLAEHAGDLEALRAKLGIEKLVPVGCAIGSMIAATYAAIHSENTHALILSNPTPRSSEPAQKMLNERAALVAREGIAAVLPGAVERAFLNQPHDARYRSYYDMFAGQDANGYAVSARSAATSDATDALKSLRCRTLLVAGRHDDLLPLENAEAVHDLVPHAEFVIAEDAAHFVPYQQPRFFADLISQFLSAKS